MSNPYNDPNFRRDVYQEMRPVSRWVTLGVLAAVVGLFVFIGLFAGSGSNRTAVSAPGAETPNRP